MLDKNGMPFPQFPPSAFSAFQDARNAAAMWDARLSHPGLSGTSAAAAAAAHHLNAAAAAQAQQPTHTPSSG